MHILLHSMKDVLELVVTNSTYPTLGISGAQFYQFFVNDTKNMKGVYLPKNDGMDQCAK